MILEYWIIKPIAERDREHQSVPPNQYAQSPQKHNGMAITSLAFGVFGMLGNIIMPFSAGFLGIDGIGYCCIPSLLFSALGLILGVISKSRASSRYSLSGIATSLIAIGIFILFFVFLVIVDANMLWCDVYPSLQACP